MSNYIIQFDGGCKGNPGPMHYGWQITRKGSDFVERKSRFDLGEGTNNRAEYSGLIGALEKLFSVIEKEKESASNCAVEIRGDSQLVLSQIQGKWKCNNPALRLLCNKARVLAAKFGKVRYKKIPRKENVRVLGM